MADRSKLDDLKDVLGGTARAMARLPDLELAYTAEAPSQAGPHLKVPMPARDLPPAQVAEARGFADSFSLKLRHHNEAMHRKNAPQEAGHHTVHNYNIYYGAKPIQVLTLTIKSL